MHDRRPVCDPLRSFSIDGSNVVYGLLLSLQAFRFLAVRFDCSRISGLYPSQCCDDGGP